MPFIPNSYHTQPLSPEGTVFQQTVTAKSVMVKFNLDPGASLDLVSSLERKKLFFSFFGEAATERLKDAQDRPVH